MSAPTKGDRVQERKTGKLGTVIGASGYGINIRMDGPEIVICNYALLVHFERDFAPAPTNPLSERQSFAAVQPASTVRARNGVNYYGTRADAQKILDMLVPEYPNARIVEYQLGFAVQYDKSCAYFPAYSAEHRQPKYFVPERVYRRTVDGRK